MGPSRDVPRSFLYQRLPRGNKCLYQVVRHLDSGFLTMRARSRMAGSRRGLYRDRCARTGEGRAIRVQSRWPRLHIDTDAESASSLEQGKKKRDSPGTRWKSAARLVIVP